MSQLSLFEDELLEPDTAWLCRARSVYAELFRGVTIHVDEYCGERRVRFFRGYTGRNGWFQRQVRLSEVSSEVVVRARNLVASEVLGCSL